MAVDTDSKGAAAGRGLKRHNTQIPAVRKSQWETAETPMLQSERYSGARVSERRKLRSAGDTCASERHLFDSQRETPMLN